MLRTNAGSEGRSGRVLRSRVKLAAESARQILFDHQRRKLCNALAEITGGVRGPDSQRTHGPDGSSIETLVHLHEGDSRFGFSDDDGPLDGGGSTVLG